MNVITTQPNDSNFHLFENFPNTIYTPIELQKRSSNNIVDKYFIAAYLVVKENTVLARIALYFNSDIQLNEKKTYLLGNYECVDNEVVSKLILDTAFSEVIKLGGEYCIGPINGSTWENYRFNLSSDDLFFTENYHHLYYNQQFINYGFNEIATYASNIDKEIQYNNPKVLELQKYFEKQGVIFRPINLDNYENELKKLYPFIIDGFKTNFLYSPISETYFLEKYSKIKPIIDPNMVIIAESLDGETLGIFFCIPDIYNATTKTLIVKTIARKNTEELRGLGHVIGNIICDNAVKAGYENIIHAFYYEEGTSVVLTKTFIGSTLRRYALYGKSI